MFNSNDWYTTWGWMLWFGMILLVFSGAGNWGYTYRVHRLGRNGDFGKDAVDLLNERYARGDIDRAEFLSVKKELLESRLESKSSRGNAIQKPSFTQAKI